MTQAPSAYVSLPTIVLSGQPHTALTNDALTVVVQESIDGLYHCEIAFNNFGASGSGTDYLYFGRDILDYGKDIAVRLGWDESAPPVFEGRITALEASYASGQPPTLTVLAEDRLQDLRMTRRTRSFEDVRDADVIEQIARDHSLTPQVDLDGPTHRSLAQVNQSDLAFIRERARAVGGELWVVGSTLYAKDRTDRDGESIELSLGAGLHTFVVRADLAHQCTELSVSGWDVAAKDAIQETAAESAISGELNGGESGSAVLETAFGARKAQVVHTVPLTTAEARSIAEARYRERARRFITGVGMADGDERIRVGRVVALAGLGNLFDGKYTVVQVRHAYHRARGFQTEFQVERPGLGS